MRFRLPNLQSVVRGQVKLWLVVALIVGAAVTARAQQSATVEPMVYVMGNIEKPSGVVLLSGMRLLGALQAAGGVKHRSGKVRIALFRLVDGKADRRTVLKLKSVTKQASLNELLQPYDIIDVSDKDGSFGHPSGRLPDTILNIR
ncbi:MAG TPA: SLBB domain-containing protein [Pyrinomonadaceae bacterium]|nr:SLBB domain-containing protein [Pyrinomonadaceae bacterium]